MKAESQGNGGLDLMQCYTSPYVHDKLSEGLVEVRLKVEHIVAPFSMT